MTWRISRSNSIIKWQGYRVSASRLAESNFRYTQPTYYSVQRVWVCNYPYDYGYYGYGYY